MRALLFSSQHYDQESFTRLPHGTALSCISSPPA